MAIIRALSGPGIARCMCKTYSRKPKKHQWSGQPAAPNPHITITVTIVNITDPLRSNFITIMSNPDNVYNIPKTRNLVLLSKTWFLVATYFKRGYGCGR